LTFRLQYYARNLFPAQYKIFKVSGKPDRKMVVIIVFLLKVPGLTSAQVVSLTLFYILFGILFFCWYTETNLPGLEGKE